MKWFRFVILSLVTFAATQAAAVDRIYILPLVESATPIVGMRVPKYVSDLDVPYSLIDAGKRNLCIVIADVSAGQHSAIIAQSDVLNVPTTLDNNLTAGAVTALQARLDQLSLPSAWVDISLTYRQALRVIAGIFQLAQRFDGMYDLNLFALLANDTQIKDAPLATRQKIAAALDSMGTTLTSADVDVNWTFKELLQHSGIAWKQVIIYAGKQQW